MLARMMRGEFYSKLAHAPASVSFAMNSFRKKTMSQKRVALFLQCWKSRQRASHQVARLGEYPWITNAPAGHADRVNSARMQHVKNIRGAPNIARAHDDSIGPARH